MRVRMGKPPRRGEIDKFSSLQMKVAGTSWWNLCFSAPRRNLNFAPEVNDNLRY